MTVTIGRRELLVSRGCGRLRDLGLGARRYCCEDDHDNGEGSHFCDLSFNRRTQLT
jgi:hypothetical protein